MRKLRVFNTISLDGRFVDAAGDMSWAHQNDEEWNAFTNSNAGGGANDNSVLVFGRVTYDMMAGFWTTDLARETMPIVAAGMSATPKLVFSRTLSRADWANTHIVRDNLAAEIRAIKSTPGGDMVILGSGSIVAQLAGEGLIDEYQLVLNPIALGGGRTLFDGIPAKLRLKRVSVREFKNGNVVLRYVP